MFNNYVEIPEGNYYPRCIRDDPSEFRAYKFGNQWPSGPQGTPGDSDQGDFDWIVEVYPKQGP